ncbi:hypothetical protein HDV62DRAFT_188096 [Trichoderma sp. SZMC 28011]
MSSFYILDGAQASLSKWWQLGLLFHFCFIFILSTLCCFACLFISCMQWLCLMKTQSQMAQAQLHILSLQYRDAIWGTSHLRDLLCLTAAAASAQTRQPSSRCAVGRKKKMQKKWKLADWTLLPVSWITSYAMGSEDSVKGRRPVNARELGLVYPLARTVSLLISTRLLRIAETLDSPTSHSAASCMEEAPKEAKL